MKAAELKKIFPAIKGREILVTIGLSDQRVTLVDIIDTRRPDNMEDLRVVCSDQTHIMAGLIKSINLNPPPMTQAELKAKENPTHTTSGAPINPTKAFCKYCQRFTEQHDDPDNNQILICNTCNK